MSEPEYIKSLRALLSATDDIDKLTTTELLQRLEELENEELIRLELASGLYKGEK